MDLAEEKLDQYGKGPQERVVHILVHQPCIFFRHDCGRRAIAVESYLELYGAVAAATEAGSTITEKLRMLGTRGVDINGVGTEETLAQKREQLGHSSSPCTRERGPNDHRSVIRPGRHAVIASDLVGCVRGENFR